MCFAKCAPSPNSYRLNFPGKIIENGDESATYDVDKGNCAPFSVNSENCEMRSIFNSCMSGATEQRLIVRHINTVLSSSAFRIYKRSSINRLIIILKKETNSSVFLY